MAQIDSVLFPLSGLDLSVKVSCRRFRFHAQFVVEKLAAAFILSQGGRALSGEGQEAHHLRVRRLVKLVESQPAGRGADTGLIVSLL